MDNAYLGDMTEGYLACALWCGFTTEEDQARATSCQGPGEVCPDTSEFSAKARGEARKTCWDFLIHNRELLSDVDPSQAGHDLWLTRNGHGAGFWDRGLGEVGEALTEACKPYGESYCYWNDDGKVEIEG